MDYKKYEKRLIENITMYEGCWLWGGVVKGFGYGRMSIGSRTDGTRKQISTHRLSYLIYRGEIGDKCVLHKCDMPSCVNPAHLFLGTHGDNNRDREAKGRGVYLSGAANKNSKHVQSEIDEIREKHSSGDYTYRRLAKEYGFKSHKSIIDIIREKTWSPKPPKTRSEL